MQIEHAKRVITELAERDPYNWSRTAQRNISLMEAVRSFTSDLPDAVPVRDRLYAVMSGTTPICPHGRLKTLKTVQEGWKGCGRANVCACAADIVSAANSATKRAQKQERAAKSGSITEILSDKAAVAHIISIIQATPSKQISAAVIKRPDLWAWVQTKTAKIDTNSAAERLYLALHGIEAATCERGNRKIFNTFDKGYRFCASDCACRREEQARKMTAHQRGLDDAERKRRVLANQSSLMKRHGVTNPMQIPDVAAKVIQTNRSRYAVEFPFQSEQIRARAKDTLIERHGVHAPMLIPGVPDKVAATNIQRYGMPHTMELARAAFAEANDGKNPFQVDSIARKARATMRRLYGVETPLSSPEILRRMQDGFEAKHGVRNPMLVPEIKAKVEATVGRRYGRSSPNQSHFDDDAWAIMNDADTFRALFTGRSLREVAQVLGMAYDTCRRYAEKHGVELSNSTYENAIVDFLRSHGCLVKRGDRTVLKPQEIDILLPEHKIGIEFCGLVYHSDYNFRRSLPPNYHIDKHDRAAQAGYKLVSIFEDEWLLHRSVVETRLLSMVGKTSRGPGGAQAGCSCD